MQNVQIPVELETIGSRQSFSCFCLQMEIDSGDGLTEEFLYEEVHPMEHTLKQAFAKPRGPGGKRGNKRIIKSPGENGEEN